MLQKLNRDIKKITIRYEIKSLEIKFLVGWPCSRIHITHSHMCNKMYCKNTFHIWLMGRSCLNQSKHIFDRSNTNDIDVTFVERQRACVSKQVRERERNLTTFVIVKTIEMLLNWPIGYKWPSICAHRLNVHIFYTPWNSSVMWAITKQTRRNRTSGRIDPTTFPQFNWNGFYTYDFLVLVIDLSKFALTCEMNIVAK